MRQHGRVGQELSLRADLEHLANQLFHEIGLQLSVARYGASNWERGANLDRIETPLNDRTWLDAEMKLALQLPSEGQRGDRLLQIANWQKAPKNGFYDDLGDPTAEPHVLRGTSWANDPEMYHAVIDGIADHTLEQGWRLSWLSYAETLYEVPLSLRHIKLNTAKIFDARHLPRTKRLDLSSD